MVDFAGSQNFRMKRESLTFQRGRDESVSSFLNEKNIVLVGISAKGVFEDAF